MDRRRPWLFHRQMLMDEPGAAEALLSLADEIENRGMRGQDRDPGETADWLRSEVQE